MANELDATIGKAMDQNFANVSAMFGQAAGRHVSDAAQLSTDAGRMFQLQAQLVGAAAAGRLDRNTLASDILQQRSAAGQPQVDSATAK